MKESLKAGDRVRIPMIYGTGSGLTRYGVVSFVEGRFVRVEVRYGKRVRCTNTYTAEQLRAEADSYAQLRTKQRRSRKRDLEAL